MTGAAHESGSQGTDAVLADLLAVENSVIYGMDSAGGVVASTRGAPAALTLLAQADTAHRSRRDYLQGLLAARRYPAPPALPGYDVPELGTTAAALAFAAVLEDRCAAAYEAAVTRLPASLRAMAAGSLRDSAVRAALLRQVLGLPAGQMTAAFPGRPAPATPSPRPA